ncbi:MAG: type II toxin-antitoxin system VapC family toxin, partial [Burkholderiales bacterium]
MIFIDSNIPMYLIGADHPCNYQARRLPERSITGSERLVTSAAVFQAILHRFTAIRRKDAIQPAFDALRSVVDEIFAIEMTDVERAREIQFTYDRLSSRDALHVAVMERHN